MAVSQLVQVVLEQQIEHLPSYWWPQPIVVAGHLHRITLVASKGIHDAKHRETIDLDLSTLLLPFRRVQDGGHACGPSAAMIVSELRRR